VEADYKNRTRAPGSEAPEDAYRRRMEEHGRELAELDRRDRALVAGRLTGFLAAVGCLIAAVAGTSTPRPAWLVAAGAAFAVFVALVVLDSRLRRRIEAADALRAVYERALARKARDWPALEAMLRTLGLPPELSTPPRLPPSRDGAAAGEAYVRDLHLFGRASLYRLVATPGTPSGRRCLAGWLTAPGQDPEHDEVAAIRARQAAVRALAPELDWRAGLEAVTWGSPRRRDGAPEDEGGARKRSGAGAGAGDEEPVLDRFHAWLAAEPYLLRRPWLMAVAWVLTVATPVSLALWLFADLPAVWLPLGGAAYLLSAVFVPRMHEAYDRATSGLDGLRGHGAIFRRLEDLPGDSPMLDGLRGRLATERRSAAEWMDALDRLVVLSDTRRGMVYFFVQVLFLWDFHVELRLERWRAATGAAARGWLEALGEVEALAALAALAHGQPDWAFPEVDPEADSFEGEDVGHPLIPDERRVGNDVTVGPPGTFLLVTGSNMSGKTTLLRAIGANAVLARTGAPACARALRLPPVTLATSVAVEDSLEEGVSFFLAELLRLKAVVAKAEEGGRGSETKVQKAEEAAGRSSRRVLYLLDEVLRGTNSAERRVAVGRVIGRLLAVGAIGAVTTHDLEMLAEGDLEAAAVPIHFRETVSPRPGGGADMTFDFRARPGLATTTNALRLLEAVGLSTEEPPGEPPDDAEEAAP
jgi:hypothetical protein